MLNRKMEAIWSKSLAVIICMAMVATTMPMTTTTQTVKAAEVLDQSTVTNVQIESNEQSEVNINPEAETQVSGNTYTDESSENLKNTEYTSIIDIDNDTYSEEGDELDADTVALTPKTVNLNHNGTIAGIRKPNMPENASDVWSGSKVYFGKAEYVDEKLSYLGPYVMVPVLFRVLDPNTTDYSQGTEEITKTHTMLLDSDSGFNTFKIDESNSDEYNWTTSVFKKWMNSDADKESGFMTKGHSLDKNTDGFLHSFTAVEKNAINESYKAAYNGIIRYQDSSITCDYSGTALTGEKVFALDAKESLSSKYGYYSFANSEEARANSKQVINDQYPCDWYVRSKCKWTFNNNVKNNVLACYSRSNSSNNTSRLLCTQAYANAAPALNLKLDSILFATSEVFNKTTNVAPVADYAGDIWNLTLKDSSLSIKQSDNLDIQRKGNLIYVPYTFSGDNVSQISVMITDKAYTDAQANVLAYGKLSTETGVDTMSEGWGNFQLPEGFNDSDHVYILAENVRGDKMTDTASTPVEIDIPEDIKELLKADIMIEKDAWKSGYANLKIDYERYDIPSNPLNDGDLELKINIPENYSYLENTLKINGQEPDTDQTTYTIKNDSIYVSIPKPESGQCNQGSIQFSLETEQISFEPEQTPYGIVTVEGTGRIFRNDLTETLAKTELDSLALSPVFEISYDSSASGKIRIIGYTYIMNEADVKIYDGDILLGTTINNYGFFEFEIQELPDLGSLNDHHIHAELTIHPVRDDITLTSNEVVIYANNIINKYKVTDIDVSYGGRETKVDFITGITDRLTYITPGYRPRYGTGLFDSVEISIAGDAFNSSDETVNVVDSMYLCGTREDKEVSAQLFYENGKWVTQSQFLHNEIMGDTPDTSSKGSLFYSKSTINDMMDYPVENFRIVCNFKETANIEDAGKSYELYCFDIPWLIDPSGFIYEAVPSNRIAGVTTEIYGAQTNNEDSARLWSDAEANKSGQTNTIITDESGLYAWDVPRGYWQVRASRRGYRDTKSAMMQVPPPRFNVNLGMVSRSAPTVESAELRDDSILVHFSKYIKTPTVKLNNFKLMNGGKEVELASVTPANPERAVDANNKPVGDELASDYTVTLKEKLIGDDLYYRYALDVTTGAAVSYADTPLTAGKLENLVVVTPVADMQADLLTAMKKGDTFNYQVKLLAEGQSADETTDKFAMRKIVCTSVNEDVVQVTDEGIVDTKGIATIQLKGISAGSANLMLSLEGSSQKGVAQVIVTESDEALTYATKGIGTNTQGSAPKTEEVVKQEIKSSNGKVPGYLSDLNSGEDPGSDPGSDPGKDPGDDPGSDPGKNPGEDPGNNPGSGNDNPSVSGNSGTQDPAKVDPNKKDPQTDNPVSKEVATLNKTYQVKGIKYKVTNDKTDGTGTVTVVGAQKKTITSISVKKTVKILGNEYRITAVGNNAFKCYKKLKTVKLGENIVKIGSSAFLECPKLKSVTMQSKNLTTIGKYAFYKCKNLKKISIKSCRLSSKKIGKNAFKGIHKKCKFSVPKKKKSAYNKLFKSKGAN